MEEVDYKKDLLEYIQEAKTKPALVAAKLSLLQAEGNEEYFEKLYSLAIEWIELLAVLDHALFSFKDVYRLMINADITHEFREKIRISNYLHQLRTETFSDDNLEEALSDLHPLKNIKSLVCKIFGFMYLDNIVNSYSYLREALDKDNLLTRSTLLCFEAPVLNELKNCLVEAREKGTIPCSCNSGFQNLGFTHSIIHAVKTYSSSENIAETSFISEVLNPTNTVPKNNSFTVCNLHKTLSDLSDILHILQSNDVTTILNAHIEAGMYDHALVYMVKHRDNINKSKVRNFEKLLDVHENSFCIELMT